MNPLKDFMGQPNNPMNSIIQMMNGGMNPQAIVNQMIKNNPQAQQLLTQIQNTSNGRSPKEMAIQYAKQKGISDKDFNALVSRLGIK